MTDFSTFDLAPELREGLERSGFTTPTPIQQQAIQPQLDGRDVLGLAQTGTGKTAAFGLPMLHELLALGGRPAPKTARALILVPTRELAVQIQETLKALAGGARLSMLLVLGGMSRGQQVRALERGVDILIATPGRLIDLMDERRVRFDETRILVLDEADRMLDMGFVKPVQRVAAKLHPRRRTALFSATMPKEVEGLAAGLLNDPVRVEVTPPGETVQKIAQSVELMNYTEKRSRLAEICSSEDAKCVIVFARTKRGADRVVENLEKDGVKSAAIHGNKAQNARQRALKDFSAGRIRVLVATDIASRGIDVKDISHVIQYDLPDEPEVYVHRIGRTGRNGAEGTAITLCAPDERDKLRAVEKVTRQRLLPEGAPEAPRGSKPKPQQRRRSGGGGQPHGAVRAREGGGGKPQGGYRGREGGAGGGGKPGGSRPPRSRSKPQRAHEGAS